MIPRRAQRRDANEKAIIEELRARNVSIIQTGEVDLIIGYMGRNYLFELKSHDSLYKKDGVTFKANAIRPSQVKIMRTYRGQYSIVTSISEILQQIGYEK